MDVFAASGTLVTSQTIGTRNTLRAGEEIRHILRLIRFTNTSALKVHATLRTTAGTLDPVEKTYEIAVNNNVAANDNYVYLTTSVQSGRSGQYRRCRPQHCGRLYARECSDEGAGGVFLRQERHLLMG